MSLVSRTEFLGRFPVQGYTVDNFKKRIYNKLVNIEAVNPVSRSLESGIFKEDESLCTKKGRQGNLWHRIHHCQKRLTIDFLSVLVFLTDTRSCEECKVILEELEKVCIDTQLVTWLTHLTNCLSQIDDDADRFGVQFVSNAERAAAKKFGITTFPKLLFFRHQEPTVYEGDLMNEEQVLEWLTSIESLDLPDKIEEATAKSLPGIIDSQEYVAVLFCE